MSRSLWQYLLKHLGFARQYWARSRLPLGLSSSPQRTRRVPSAPPPRASGAVRLGAARDPALSAKILPQGLWASSPQALHQGFVGSIEPASPVERWAASLNSPPRTLPPRSAGDREDRSVLLALVRRGALLHPTADTTVTRRSGRGVAQPAERQASRRRGVSQFSESISQGWRRLQASRTARRQEPHERYGVRAARLRVRRASLASHSEAPEAETAHRCPFFPEGIK
jgi:hypothetical protein